MSKTIIIRDLDESSAAWVAREAARRGIDEEAVLKELIHQGIDHGKGPPVYRDLDHLAGTWTAEEAEELRKTTEPFSRVDEDLWRRRKE